MGNALDAFLLIGQSNMAGKGQLEDVPQIEDPRTLMYRDGVWMAARAPSCCIFCLQRVTEEHMDNEGQPRRTLRDDLAVERNLLAHKRTALANSRTLLAYFRTALALIIAGASVVRFLSASGPLVVAVGWVLIVAGILTAACGIVHSLKTRAFLARLKNTVSV